MKVLKDGVAYTSKTVYESDNYGFISQVWPAGVYSVIFKADWHADDVRDFAFRIYAPASITITKSTITQA